MVDFIHLSNLIQGEVLRIKERRSPEAQEGAYEAMIQFLADQRQTVIIEKLKLTQTTPPDSQR